MAEKLDDQEIIYFQDLVTSSSIQVDALAQLLIDKGIFTQEEYFEKLKQVEAAYQKRQGRP